MHEQAEPTYNKTNLRLKSAPAKSNSNLTFELKERARLETYEWQPGYSFRVQIPAEKSMAPTPTPLATAAAYDFIVGCFSNLQNAQTLQLKLQRDGFAARLIQNGPLTKVSAGAAQNLTELQQIQQQAAARGLQGWVLNN
jgi:cell division protein FtsN